MEREFFFAEHTAISIAEDAEEKSCEMSATNAVKQNSAEKKW